MKITYADKESLIDSPLPNENKVTDDDMNEIKNVVNSNADDFENATEVTTGSGTINSTYVSNVENNHWERVGKVVSYAFTIRATGTWDYTTTFVTGLPKPVANTRFLGINTSGNVPFRCILGTNGIISNAYSSTTPTNNQVLEGQITYITSE